MVEILPKIIFVEQDLFIKERHIFDGIILMHETIHSIKSSKEEAIIIKLDMQKSYDRI